MSSDFKLLMERLLGPTNETQEGSQQTVETPVEDMSNYVPSYLKPQSKKNFVEDYMGLNMTKTQDPTKITDFSSKALARMLTDKGIEDPNQQAGILAQIKAESNYEPQSENLNYNPERLLEVFPKYFKDLNDAKDVVSQGVEAIGNRIYGGRMGNKSDEGYKYRGRGFIQLTGKENYKKYGKKIGVDLVNNPDLANKPEIAFQLAVAYLNDRSEDLSDAYSNTKGVAPVNWRDKVEERASLQDQILKEILS